MALPLFAESDALPIFDDWALAFVHASTQLASKYWDSCRGYRLMPTLSDLSLRGMKAFVADVGLIDVVRHDGTMEFSIRLVGENVRRVFGNIARRDLREVVPPEGQARWRKGYELTVNAKRRLRVYGTVSFEGKNWLDFESLLAPLGSGDSVTMLFSVFASLQRIEPLT